jgi:hypothetical protein
MPSEEGMDDEVQQDKVANLDHPLEDIIRIIVSPVSVQFSHLA